MKLSEDRIGRPICRSKKLNLYSALSVLLKSLIIFPTFDVTPLQHGGEGFGKPL